MRMPNFDVQAAVRLGQQITFLAQIGRIDLALQRLPALLAMAPDWHLAHLAHAMVLAAAGRHSEALEAAIEAVRLEPEEPSTHHALAKELLAAGRADEASAEIDQAIAQDPEVAAYHVTRAAIARARDRQDDAIASLRQAVALEPEEPDHVLALVETLDWRAHPEEARRRLREILALDPRNARVFYRLGQIALERHEHQDARFWFTETLRADPEHKHAANALDGLDLVGEDRIEAADPIGEIGRAMRAAMRAVHRRPVPPGERRLTLDKLGLLVAAHARFLAELAPGTELTWERLTFAGRSFEYFTEPGIKRLGDQLVLRDYELMDLVIPEADLAYANLAASSWRATAFERCDLRRAIATDVTAHDVRFADCRLERVDFSDARLVDCTFEGGCGDALDLERATLERCTFRDITLVGARFVDAVVTACRFERVDLSTLVRRGARFEACELVACTPATLD